MYPKFIRKFLFLIKNTCQLRKPHLKPSKDELTKPVPHICCRENSSVRSIERTPGLNGILREHWALTLSLGLTETVPKSFRNSKSLHQNVVNPFFPEPPSLSNNKVNKTVMTCLATGRSLVFKRART